MSFFDDASLVFLPSGEAGKDGKAYSIKPTDGSGDFTFSRGSNLTATRVDSNGLIEKGRENLITQSNDLSDFTPQGLTTTPNQADPFGGNNATLFTENLSGGNHRFYLLNVPSSSAVHTYSIYIKYSGRSRFKLVINGGNPNATFNTQTGAYITDSGNIIDYKTESIGNDWHRVSFASVCSGWVGGYFVNDSGQDSYTGDGTSGVILFGAQVEIGLVATEYIESGASTGKAGILEDSPRFDYSGGASCPSLLLEPSRTNLITSEYFDDWTKIGVSVETNTSETLSPEGLYNATKITSTTADPNIYKQVSVTATETTFSFYIKGEGSSIGKTSRVLFWYTGTATGSTTSHNFILTGEWQRISFSTTPTGSGTMSFRIDTPADSADVGETAYIWGAQVEEGSYPTSYIPNHSGGSVTRNADVCEGAGTSSTFNDDEGVLYVEASALANDGTSRMIALSDATSANHIRIYPTTTDNRITIAIKSGNVNQYVYHYDGLSDITDTWKVAVRYKRDDFATFVNGTKVHSSSSGSVATGLDELQFNGGASANPFYGKSNQVIVFNSYLSDANCITLTS